jgi:hypothetical protein
MSLPKSWLDVGSAASRVSIPTPAGLRQTHKCPCWPMRGSGGAPAEPVVWAFLQRPRCGCPLDGHDAEFAGLFNRNFQASHGHFGTACGVFGQHDRVIHFVHMVAAQYQHPVWPGFVNDAQVLVHRVGRAAVPALAVLLLRGHHIHVLAQAGGQETPPAFNVANQALRLVLGQHTQCGAHPN